MLALEILIGLTAFGVLCVAVIEILEKCEHRQAHAEHEVLRQPHVAP